MEVYIFTIRRLSVHVCVLSRFSHVWLFETLWIIARQASLSMGFCRQDYWSGLPCPPLGDLPSPGIESAFLMSLALAGRFFTTATTWEAQSEDLVQFSHSVESDSLWHLSIINSQSLLKLMSIESAMPSNHLILCRPLLLSPSIFPSIRFFSNESVLHIRWPKYWSFSFRISPSNEYSGLISFRMDWLDLLEVQGTLKSLLQYHSSKSSTLRH